METLIHLMTQASALAAGSLVAAIWEGLVLAACVWVCLRSLPGISAAARCVVWLAVMLAVAVLPFVHLSGTSAPAVTTWQVHVDERFSLALACVWAIFSLVRGAELLRSAVWLRRVALRAAPAPVSPGIAQLLAGARRQVEIRTSEEVDRPSVIGFFSPCILLPESLLARISESELQQIVMHELEHLRRGDDWTNLLQKLSLVLFPLNPVLLWVERRLCLERELACDDQVLRATRARKAYAACLANLAEHSLVRRGVSLALGAWERQSELVRRVHRILLRPGREMGTRQVGIAVALMLFGLAGGVDVLAHSPRLISFDPAVQVASGGSAARTVGPAQGLAQNLKQDVVFHPASPAQATNPRLLVSGVDARLATPRKISPAKSLNRPRSTLTKAVMPAARQFSRRNAVQANHLALRTSFEPTAAGDQQATGPETMFVLVTWRPAADADQAPAATQSSPFSYAAIPLRNGWLFVQL